MNEHGAKGMAQAGAFAARATDGSAVFFNPAGLAWQNQPSFYGGATIIIPTTSFYGPLQNNTNEKIEAPSQFFTPINFYLTIPATDRLHLGIGVNNPYGLGSEWPEDWAGRFLTTKVTLQTFYFTQTASYKVLDNLAVAAGFNYVVGTVNLQRAVSIPLQAAGGDPRVTMDLSGTGAGWSLGAMYKYTPEISLGASFRSSVKMDATGTAAFKPNYLPLGLPSGDVSASIRLPATLFVGAAYTPKDEPWEVEADYQWIGWSSYKELAISFKSNGSRVVQPKNYQDTYILRIGGQYTLGEFKLRGGYFYDHTPVDAQHVDPILPDANRHGLNVGFGYEISKGFTVDFAYMLLLFNERKAENTIPETSFDGTFHTHVNLIGIDFGYTL